MSNILVEVENMDSGGRGSRPSLVQMKAVVQFMRKHPDLAHRKLRNGLSHRKFKKLWIELSNIVNSLGGAMKSTKGWIKFWSDKRRNILTKQKQIKGGKLQGKLTPLEQTIFDLCDDKSTSKKKRNVKDEPYNSNEDDDDNDSDDEFLSKNVNDELKNLISNENDESQMNIMEKLVDVMGQQATAMAQMAQAQLAHSKSLERFAEASHIQALAVNRLASTFENIGSSVHDVRNALLGIDYTMKRCYSSSATLLRPNANIFS